MNLQSKTAFTHRPDPEGGTASFCNRCLETVATSQFEADLDAAEKAHVCDPLKVEYWESEADNSTLPHRFIG